MTDYTAGCRLPMEEWLWLNRTGIFDDQSLRKYASPFPPKDLMHNVSGLERERDFANHGTDIYRALSLAAPKPLADFDAILDFGCGCGRLARLFKGHTGRIYGCDIDPRHVAWINQNLDHMRAKVSSVRPPLPYADNEFDAIISISVFTHLNEKSQDEFLAELHRICKPGGPLFLTVHGSRALARATEEKPIRDMIAVAEEPFQQARQAFALSEHAFILQDGHLTNTSGRFSLRGLFRRRIVKELFEYGIAFTPESYIRRHWTRWFDIADYRDGAIHSFQDIVVLIPKK